MNPIVVKKEIEGFLLNRLQYTLVAEAMHLVGEGYCTAADIDKVVTDGLARRWSFIGPFMVAHLNASKGFKGFVDQLGPMMKQIGKNSKTDYDWQPQLIDDIHNDLAEIIPVSDIREKQIKRDEIMFHKRFLKTDLDMS
jgi:3-hydroxyacyl-CoA dehydrogenase